VIPDILKNLMWQRAANCLCMLSSVSETVIVIESQATEAYSSSDQTKAKYSVIGLSMVENWNCDSTNNNNNNSIQINSLLFMC
jgi:hypothetical protein